MQISECNPFVRAAEIQPAVLEGNSPRIAYDHRIFLILEGNGTILIENREIPLSAHSFIFIPPDVEYYFRGKMKVIVLNFDMTRNFQSQRKPQMPVPREIFDESRRFDRTLLEGFGEPVIFFADELECDTVKQIVAAFVSKRPMSDAITSALLKKLLAEILDKQTAVRDSGMQIAEKIVLYIRENVAQIKSNDQVARAFGYHPFYLSSLVKEKTGKTLHSIILEERVRLARRFLRFTDSSVEEIAFNTGFSSRNHFCTTFKRIVGDSPLSYRGKRNAISDDTNRK